MVSPIINAMTVDVEDYFQVAAFDNCISRDDWDSIVPRVEQNTHAIMDMFSEHGIKATFFTLGWVAERFPGLVERMVQDGHEVASHGYAHAKATTQTPQQFQKDISHAKALLEDLAGREVIGYRAPSYSIGKDNLWAHEEIENAGYRYSSSVYPIKHDHYGFPDAPRFIFKCREKLQEIPISTLNIFGKNIPIGGGGYFRFFPYGFSRWAIKQFNTKENQSAIFYFHPWEIDPEQPRQEQAGGKSKFRHYLNLHKMKGRLNQLCQEFSWGRMDEVFLK